MHGQTKSTWNHIVLAAVIAIAAGLRLYHLGAESLWLDEIGQALVAQQPLSAILDGVRSHHGAAPLDYLITALTVRTSHNEWVLRLPSALWGVLSVYWVYRLGRQVHSEMAGLIAAFFLAISPLHIQYSQEVRFYALFVLIALMATEALWRAWKRNDFRAWTVYAGLMILGLYTHLYTGLILMFHAVWVLIKWISAQKTDAKSKSGKALRGFVLAGIAISVTFLPWFVYSVLQERGASLFSTPIMALTLIENVLANFGGGSETWKWLWGLLAVIGIISIGRKSLANAVFLAVWVLVSLPVIIFVDQWVNYFFNIRQVLFVLPIFLLLVGAGITGLALRLGHLIRRESNKLAEGIVVYSVALAFTLLFGFGAWPRINAYYAVAQHEDWRSIGATLADNLSLRDSVILFNAEPYVGYYSLRAARQVSPASTVTDMQSIYDSNRPVWVLDTPYLGQLPEAQAIRSWLDDRPSLSFHYGMGMRLHYLDAKINQSDLWRLAGDLRIPEQPHALDSQAQALRSAGERAKALEAYKHAAQLTVDSDLKTRHWLGAADAAFLLEDYDQAQALFDQVLSINPESAETYLRKGFVYLEAGQPLQALEMFDIAHGEFGLDEYYLHRWSATALAQIGRPDEALQHYLLALKKDATAHDLRYLNGNLYEQLGQISEARKWWQSYMEHDPQGPWATDATKNLERTSAKTENK